MADEEDRDATQAASPPEPQTFGSGRYLARRLLGEGAQKTVYLVHDTALGRDCALSLLKTEDLQGDDLARLRREAQTMAGLTHGNIVAVYDISDEGVEGSYLVSEYVPGGDLRQELQGARGPLPLRRAIAIAKDLCQALAAAHEQGVVHRDLKPGNVWLTKQGSAKLGDFGIAHSIERSRLTMPGTMMGTAAYMAPEQAEGRGVTERSDLYSLGCVLYEMLTGRPPFEGDDPLAVVSQHVHAQPAPPSEHGAALPQALERLVLLLLAKEPDRRPASAEEVLAELERIEAVLPANQTVRPARDVARLLTRLWARRAFRFVSAVLLLAAFGGSVAGAVLLSGGGGGAGPGVEIAFQVDLQTTSEFEVSGDCVSEDLVVAGGSNRGEVTGDITGVVEPATGPTTLYAADDLDERCQSGYGDWTHTFTDEDGNTLRYTLQGPTPSQCPQVAKPSHKLAPRFLGSSTGPASTKRQAVPVRVTG